MNHESINNNTEPSVEFPSSSKDEDVQAYIDGIKQAGREGAVLDFINEMASVTPETYGSIEEFKMANPDYDEKIHQNLSTEEKEALISYSGYNFAWINSVARGFWDYDKMGKKTAEREESIKESTKNIISAIAKAPAPEKDFMTFRGTNLDEFRKYGIENVSDLTKMKGQFMFEGGFTSTAMAEENSFMNHDEGTLWTGASNVEMRFHIPSGTNNVIALTSTEITAALGQTEVLIDHDSLLFVSNVSFNEENRAILDVLLIPIPVIYGRELNPILQ